MLRENSNSSRKRGGWLGAIEVRLVLIMVVALTAAYIFIHKFAVLETIYWQADTIELLQMDGTWTAARTVNIERQTDLITFRTIVKIDGSDKWREPIGLLASGPFSATLIWDGKVIGRKGSVAAADNEEVPGSIDFISHIPTQLLASGEHVLQVRLSTQYLRLNTERIVHLIALVPYRQDHRRQLRYYAAPTIFISGFLLLIILSVRNGLRSGGSVYLGLAQFAVFVLIALLAEVSRAALNYGYEYHDIRVTVMWLSTVLAGLSIVYICYRNEQEAWARGVLLGFLVVFVLTASLFVAGDKQLASIFIILTAGPALVYGLKWRRAPKDGMGLFPVYWAACLASVLHAHDVFLDTYFFAASLIFLMAFWVWDCAYGEPGLRGLGEGLSGQDMSVPNPSFVIKSAGREQYIACDTVVYLKAEGNFTRLYTLDGDTFLHQDRLGTIMGTPRVGFLRVHKSYAANIAYAQVLRSAEGSKYWLELCVEETVPVSRYKVAEIRAALKVKQH